MLRKALYLILAGTSVYLFWHFFISSGNDKSDKKIIDPFQIEVYWQKEIKNLKGLSINTQERKKSQRLYRPQSRTSYPDSSQQKRASFFQLHNQETNILAVFNRQAVLQKSWLLPQNSLVERDLHGYNSIIYQKTGAWIHFLTAGNDKIFSRKSYHYPKISPLGNYFLLINSDASEIAIYSFADQSNGELIPALPQSTLLTASSWSEQEETLALAYLRGSVLLIKPKAKIYRKIYRREFLSLLSAKIDNFNQDNFYIKNLVLSLDGKNFLIQHGDAVSDFVSAFKIMTLPENEGKRQKIAMQHLCSCYIGKSLPYASAMAISSEKEIKIAAQHFRTLKLFNQDGKRLEYIASQDTSPLEVDKWLFPSYFQLSFTERNDLLFLVKRKQEGYRMHLWQNSANKLLYRHSLYLGKDSAMRAIPVDRGKNLLIEGKNKILYISLYRNS